MRKIPLALYVNVNNIIEISGSAKGGYEKIKGVAEVLWMTTTTIRCFEELVILKQERTKANHGVY